MSATVTASDGANTGGGAGTGSGNGSGSGSGSTNTGGGAGTHPKGTVHLTETRPLPKLLATVGEMYRFARRDRYGRWALALVYVGLLIGTCGLAQLTYELRPGRAWPDGKGATTAATA